MKGDIYHILIPVETPQPTTPRLDASPIPPSTIPSPPPPPPLAPPHLKLYTRRQLHTSPYPLSTKPLTTIPMHNPLHDYVFFNFFKMGVLFILRPRPPHKILIHAWVPCLVTLANTCKIQKKHTKKTIKLHHHNCRKPCITLYNCLKNGWKQYMCTFINSVYQRQY